MSENNIGDSSSDRTPLFESENSGLIPLSPSNSKICTKCNHRKELEEFAKKPKGGVLGRSSDCKVCHRKVNRVRYLKDDKEKNRLVADRLRKFKIARAYVEDLKAKSQCKCGYKGIALQFHHLGNKDKTISMAVTNGWILERIKKEIAKCEILCANCHMELHHEERNKK